MEQEIILNIHYTAPQDIWDKIGKVYESMLVYEFEKKDLTFGEEGRKKQSDKLLGL